MNDPRQKSTIKRWVSMVLAENFEETPCTSIALMHVSASGGQTEVKTTTIGKGRSWTNEELSNFIYDLAQSYAQDLMGVQNFMMLAFFGSNEPKARQPFILSGHLDNHGLGTESPSPEGRLSQKMRHEEVLIQGMMMERQELLRMPLETIRAMSNYQNMLLGHMSTLQKENVDAVQAVKEMLLKDAAEQAKRQVEVLKYKEGAKLRDRLFTAASLFLNEATGKEIIPQGVSDSILIESMAENIPEEAFEEMLTTGKIPVEKIPPEILGMLMKRMRSALEKKRQLEEEAIKHGGDIEKDASEDPLLTEGEHGNGQAH